MSTPTQFEGATRLFIDGEALNALLDEDAPKYGADFYQGLLNLQVTPPEPEAGETEEKTEETEEAKETKETEAKEAGDEESEEAEEPKGAGESRVAAILRSLSDPGKRDLLRAISDWIHLFKEGVIQVSGDPGPLKAAYKAAKRHLEARLPQSSGEEMWMLELSTRDNGHIKVTVIAFRYFDSNARVPQGFTYYLQGEDARIQEATHILNAVTALCQGTAQGTSQGTSQSELARELAANALQSSRATILGRIEDNKATIRNLLQERPLFLKNGGSQQEHDQAIATMRGLIQEARERVTTLFGESGESFGESPSEERRTRARVGSLG